MNERRIALLLLLVALTVSTLACGASGGTDGPPVYSVTKSTGLYSIADPDAELLRELPVGTLLIPAGGEQAFRCLSVEEFGTTYNLCHVEVQSSGETGWVLKQWTEPQ